MRLADGARDVPFDPLERRPRALFAVRKHLQDRSLVAIHAIKVVDRGHVGRAESIFLERAIAHGEKLLEGRLRVNAGPERKKAGAARAGEGPRLARVTAMPRSLFQVTQRQPRRDESSTVLRHRLAVRGLLGATTGREAREREAGEEEWGGDDHPTFAREKFQNSPPGA